LKYQIFTLKKSAFENLWVKWEYLERIPILAIKNPFGIS
jgi:hypothetical protein